MHSLRPSLARGFTIVELLVVIVVIGILAGLILNTYAGVQAKARDTQVRVAANEVAKALTIWSIDTGLLPSQSGAGAGSTAKNADGTCTGSTNYTGWVLGNQICTFYDILSGQKYLPSNFVESLPKNTVSSRYNASSYLMMLYGCAGTNGRGFVLMHALEAPNDNDKQNFDAVTAKGGLTTATFRGTYGMQAAKLLEF